MQDLFRHLHFDPAMAVEFQAVFSRMEYALKMGGFAVGNDRGVEPNWDAFANTVNAAFMAIADADVVEARKYLLQSPPRKNVLLGDKLDFADQVVDPKQAPTQQVIRMVRTVRNNLFHGGKYLPDGEKEAGRNEQLVRASLCVLHACSGLDDLVRTNFEH